MCGICIVCRFAGYHFEIVSKGNDDDDDEDENEYEPLMMLEYILPHSVSDQDGSSL